MSPKPPDPRAPAAPRLVARSPALLRVLAQVERAAPTGATALILGERGVGKEGLARRWHTATGRTGPLVAVNCATIQAALAESQLFGHARGAFTGAASAARGHVREAHGGTLFLDEVGELPLEVQARLLRLLQEGVVQPLGEREQAVDVRIVAATNRDLDALATAGRFRADLRDRLMVMVLRVPPLRERTQEIVPLAEHFLKEAPELRAQPRRRLSAGARAALRAHDWPGNVRELRNVVVRAAILCRGPTLDAAAIRRSLHEGAPRPTSPAEREAPGGRVEPASDARPPEDTSAAVLALLAARTSASTGEMARALGVHRSSVKRAVGALREQGAVTQTGAGRSARVQLQARPLPAPAPAIQQAEAPTSCAPSPPAQSAVSAEAIARDLARRHGSTTSAAVAEAIGRDRRTAQRLLAGLCERGLLRAVGFARARRYLCALDTTETPPVASQPNAPNDGPATPAPLPATRRPARPTSPPGASAAMLAQRSGLPEPLVHQLLDALGALGQLRRPPRGPPRRPIEESLRPP